MNENDNEYLRELNREIGERMGQKPAAPDEAPAYRRGLRAAHQKKFQLSRKAITWIVVLGLIVLIVGGGAGAYGIIRLKGRNTLQEHLTVEGVEFSAPEEAIVADGGVTVTWKGKTYEKKDTVINILCMGIDRTSTMESVNEDVPYGDGGQADSIFLAVMDTTTGQLSLLNISRDTITDVDVYNENGEYAGTEPMQICLAHAYGDGGDSSCLNMVKAVSSLMFGVPIDAYVSIDIPAVSILNDAIGGVEVTVIEDLSDHDPSLTEGSRVLLKGNLAEIYVRSRSQTAVEANNLRMARQRQYVSAFIRKAYSQIRNDWSVALTLYQTVQAYSNTSLRLSQILYLSSVAVRSDFSDKNIVTLPGEVTMGEKYAEYHVDDEELFQLIIDTYYREVS